MAVLDLGSLTARRAALAAAAILLAYTLINPVGFLGGGWDDWQYLNAARCWVANGPCLPHDHWQGRWPIVGPLALSIGLLGENRVSVGLPSLIATIACFPSLALIGNRLFGSPVGYGAGLLFLLTPIVAVELYDPNIEIVEFAFLAAGFAALLVARDDIRPRWPILAGLLFALAFQARETAIVPIAVAGAYVLLRYPHQRAWGILVAAFPAFALPFVIELLGFWQITGDALWRRHQSLNHVLIPSTELLVPVDRHRGPFFNVGLIANWRHEPGIHVHWAIDGLVNLLINTKAGITLWASPLLLLFYRRDIAGQARASGWHALGAALLIAGGYIYALSIDPKARMMYPVIALCCLCLAMVFAKLEANGRGLIVRVMALVALGTALFEVAIFQQMHHAEPSVRAWIARYPGRIAAVENTRRHLALLPEAERLPSPGKRSTDMLLIKLDMPCDRWIQITGLQALGWQLIERVPLSYLSYLRPELGGAVCLYRARSSVDAGTVQRAIARTFALPRDNA